MADHRVRVILEAVNKGGANVRKFFAENDKEVQKFRKSLREANDELNIFFSSSGPRIRSSGGQFISTKDLDDVSKAILKMRELREEMRRTSGQSAVGGLVKGFSEGRGELAAVRKAVKERIELSKEAAQAERRAVEQERFKQRQRTDASHFEERQLLEDTVVTDRKIIDAARIRNLRDQAAYHQDRIDAARKAAVKEGGVISQEFVKQEREQEQAHRRAILRIEAERDAFIRARREGLRAQQQGERKDFDNETKKQVREINAPDIAQIVTEARAEFQKLNSEIEKTDNRLTRFGRNAGRSMSELALGLSIGRRELSDTDKQFVKSESRLTRLGVAFSQATRGANQFVNVRWAVIISFLQLFLTLVVQLGVALVALASSAIQAGAALGGALLAGLTQLIPVMALLKFALSDLSEVLDALKLDEKLQLSKASDQKDKLEGIANATDRLADSRYALMKAGQAVKDAEYDLVQAGIAVKDAIKDQKDAIDNLAEARQQAARDIVDANLEEKEAALDLAEAELSVLEARRKLREESERAKLGDQNIDDAKAQVKEAQARLTQARAEGDTAEVTVALQQLNQAEQSLQQVSAGAEEAKNNAKQAQIDVKQAEINQQQAIVRNKRAQEDGSKARKDGVSGSDRVIRAQEQLADATRNIARAERQQVLAQRAVADAIHGLTAAKRDQQRAEEDLTDSQTKQSAAQEQLQEKMADMSPAQKRLFASLKKFRKIFKDNFQPITDIITDSFSRAVDKAVVIIQDPAILRAARKLAGSIAGAIDTLADFAISPEFRKFLTFTIENAAKNVPKITDAFINLFRILMRIATAATPLFNKLLERFEKFTEKLEKRTRDTSGLDKFFQTAGKHLDSWIRFGAAVGRLLGFVIKLSAPAGGGGGGLIDSLTDKLNEWSEWLSENQGKVRKFFKNIQADVEVLSGVLGRVGKILFEAFTSPEASALSVFILETMIPAFTAFLFILGVIARILNAIFDIPIVGQWAKWAVQGALIYGLFVKLIPVSRKFFAIMVAGMKAVFSGAALARLKSFIETFRLFLLMVRTEGIKAAFLAAFPKLAAGIRLVGLALKFVFLTNPWIAVIAGIIAAVILLDRKFHFIRPTIEFLGKLFRRIFEWVKKNWKLLAAILFAPFAGLAYVLIRWHDKIIGFIKAVIDWVKRNWKLLLLILLGPFALTGAVILAIIKWRDKIFTFFKELPGKIAGFMSKLPGLLMKIFEKIPGLLKKALGGLKDIVGDALSDLPVVGRFFGGGGPSDTEKTKQRATILAALPKKAKKRGAELLDEHGSSQIGAAKTLAQLVEENVLAEEQAIGIAKTLKNKLSFQRGGSVPGAAGQAVPILAHAGEWVINKMQQAKLSKRLGESTEQTKMFLFGTKSNTPPGQAKMRRDAKQTARAKEFYPYADFNLVGQVDEGSTDAEGNSIIVWFLEMADGAFGQVSARDAARIKKSNGTWVPGYVKRSTHGYAQKVIQKATQSRINRMGKQRGKAGFDLGGVVQAFAGGGVVQNYAGPMLQSFAEGGTVLQQGGFGAPGMAPNKSIEQNFNVTANHDTDWNYVLRLGAIHAQASYS